MDLANPTSHAAQAYATAGRFVPLLSPPAATGPRFELPAPTSLPRTAPPTPAPPPPTSDAAAPPAALPRPALPPPAPIDLTATGPAAGPADILTLHRATALYSQTQQLTAVFGVRQPSLLTPSAPSDDAASQAPAVPPQHIGPVGIYSLGGVAASPTHLLAFARGTFLNVLT
jgi:hypothetical protein